MLEGCGFIWDSHEASWSEKVQDLLKFIEEHGHAHVPSSYPKSPQLATWVKVSQPLAWYIHVSPIHNQNSMEHDELTHRRSSSCYFSVPTSTVQTQKGRKVYQHDCRADCTARGFRFCLGSP